MKKTLTAREKWDSEHPDYYKNYNKAHKKKNVERVLSWRKKNRPEYNEYMRNLQRKLRQKKKKE